ncbi:MAG: hypothetical protein IKM04_02165 [Clostridia bacterium]|nr:hypothetical protein [Clostridia bacterium]
MEETNTLNGVEGAVVGTEGSGSDGSEAASASDARTQLPDKQTAKENAGFARLRRENEALNRRLGDLTASARRNDGYRRAAFKAQYESDMRQIKEAFPDESANDVQALGKEYARLRAAGIDNLTAYGAVRLLRKSAPPEIGAVADTADARDFYTGAELDALSERQLSDPKVLERAIRSLARLKKGR